MSLLQLAWSYLRARPLGTLLNVVLLTLGVATIGFVWIVDRQVGDRIDRDARGVDLVVGAKGSPMQLILAGIYQLDAPTGNIPFDSVRTLASNPLVRRVIPLSLGDSFHGYRIVGTSPDYVALYGGKLASGDMWHGHMQAIVGSSVAHYTGLHAGSSFAGSHGLSEGGTTHQDSLYNVVGVLAPTDTVLDRLVLVDTESVWLVHETHHASRDQNDSEGEREVTVLLLQYASPLAAVSLPRRINADTKLQAASPAYESARLFRMIGIGADVIRAFGAIVLATAALSLFIALYQTLNERAYDIAVLRTLGASPANIGALLVLEALFLAVLGSALGLILAHGLVAFLAWWMTEQQSLQISGAEFSMRELLLFVPATFAAVLAAVLPAVRAARLNISATLARRY